MAAVGTLVNEDLALNPKDLRMGDSDPVSTDQFYQVGSKGLSLSEGFQNAQEIRGLHELALEGSGWILTTFSQSIRTISSP